ncbi:hypothetical protein [Frondihabitans peucedani]|uniref:hypothetical protein n=1 Tax=Frondihabitans peucedani TaxID=598626 RepID=UPI0031E12EB2
MPRPGTGAAPGDDAAPSSSGLLAGPDRITVRLLSRSRSRLLAAGSVALLVGLAVALPGAATAAPAAPAASAAPAAAASATVAPAPRLVTKPTLVGIARDGKTLTATLGTWSVPDLHYHFIWYRSGRVVLESSSPHYALSGWDTGHTLMARVRVSKSGYASALAQTPTTGSIAAPQPVFSGSGFFKVNVPGGVPIGVYYMQMLPNAADCGVGESTTPSWDGERYFSYMSGQLIMEVKKGDKYWGVEGCGPWYPIGTAGPAHTSIPGDGSYRVGSQLAVGTYVTDKKQGGQCAFEYRSEANEVGDYDESIGHGDRLTAVVTKSTFVFWTRGCGSWTKVH